MSGMRRAAYKDEMGRHDQTKRMRNEKELWAKKKPNVF